MELNGPFVDDEDSGQLDLTPRHVPPVGGRSGSRGRRTTVLAVLGLVVVALAVVAWQGLNNATLYFRNADEAVAERQELGDRRFRLQGSVVDGSVDEREGEVRFVVAYNGVEVPVRHIGDPPELFQPDIPVVLEGRWAGGGSRGAGDGSVDGANDGTYFASDRILVKHSSEYQEDNPDRTDSYVGDEGSE